MNQVQDLEWLIVGGGIHGTHLSHLLVNGLGVARDRVAVLDPHDDPMWRWRHCTHNTTMTHLRSPAVHHIGLAPMELLNFARSTGGRSVPDFRPPYDRPSLALFEAHCRRVIDEGGLRELRRRGRAIGLSNSGDDRFCVETDQGTLRSRRVVLAMGGSDRLRWPPWAAELRDQGGPVWHIFEDGFHRDLIADKKRIAVVGLGISAAQLATHLTESGRRQVHLVGRHELRVQQFDSDPCWLGPKCQVSLRRHSSLSRRREMIEEARHRGSMPTDVARAVRQLEEWGHLTIHRRGCEGASVEGATIKLRLPSYGEIIIDGLVLATGFEAPRPDRGWLGPPIEELNLPCAPCGFPIVDDQLQWAPGLFVSGGLAELELGPAARNIAGARMTARRISRAA